MGIVEIHPRVLVPAVPDRHGPRNGPRRDLHGVAGDGGRIRPVPTILRSAHRESLDLRGRGIAHDVAHQIAGRDAHVPGSEVLRDEPLPRIREADGHRIPLDPRRDDVRPAERHVLPVDPVQGPRRQAPARRALVARMDVPVLARVDENRLSRTRHLQAALLRGAQLDPGIALAGVLRLGTKRGELAPRERQVRTPEELAPRRDQPRAEGLVRCRALSRFDSGRVGFALVPEDARKSHGDESRDHAVVESRRIVLAQAEALPCRQVRLGLLRTGRQRIFLAHLPARAVQAASVGEERPRHVEHVVSVENAHGELARRVRGQVEDLSVLLDRIRREAPRDPAAVPVDLDGGRVELPLALDEAAAFEGAGLQGAAEPHRAGTMPEGLRLLRSGRAPAVRGHAAVRAVRPPPLHLPGAQSRVTTALVAAIVRHERDLAVKGLLRHRGRGHRFGIAPGLDRGRADGGLDQADRNLQGVLHVLRELVSDGSHAERLSGFVHEPPAADARVGRRQRARLDDEAADLRVAGLRGLLRVVRAPLLEGHVGLPGAEPDLADQHVLRDLAADMQFLRPAPRRAQVEPRKPAARCVRRGARGRGPQRDHDLLARVRESEDGGRRRTVQHGVVRKEGRRLDLCGQGATGAGEQQQSNPSHAPIPFPECPSGHARPPAGRRTRPGRFRGVRSRPTAHRTAWARTHRAYTRNNRPTRPRRVARKRSSSVR